MTTAERCLCTVCAVPRGADALWTSDGYCAFCAQYCFLPMTANGQFGRAVRSVEDRAGLHAKQMTTRPAPPAAPGRAPGAIRSIDDMVDRIHDPTLKLPLRAAVAVLDHAMPKVGGAVKIAWDVFKGRKR